MHELTIPIVLLAGIISFLSPSVLPLVPGYIAVLAGRSMRQLRTGGGSELAKRNFGAGVVFMTGFSIGFIGLGVSATAVGSLLLAKKRILETVAGIAIIAFGLHLTSLVKMPSRDRDERAQAGAPRHRFFIALKDALKGKFIGALIGELVPSLPEFWREVARKIGERVRLRSIFGTWLLGLAFAFGWTPRIGPVLAAVLSFAADRGTVFKGMFLLAIYSVGLAIPFLITSLGLIQLVKFLSRSKKHLRAVEVASGVLLMAIGMLMILDKVTVLSDYLSFLNRLAL